MRILPEESIGLLIDFQEKLASHMYESVQVTRNIEILIQGLQILKIPIVATQQYSKGLGPTIPALENLLEDSKIIEKITFSCCGEENFMQQINRHGRKNIIISGIETHICVLQSTVDLIKTGYQPVIVEDCTTSRKLNDKKIALQRLLEEGAIITTFESILFELCQIAGNERFKAISKLVK